MVRVSQLASMHSIDRQQADTMRSGVLNASDAGRQEGISAHHTLTCASSNVDI